MNNRLAIFVVLIVIAGSISFFLGGQKENTPQNQIKKSTNTESPTTAGSKECSQILTPSQTEGPYYKSGSPLTNNISQGINGEMLVVTGYVFDKNCKPIANAWLDFWQADGNGVYDNEGFKLRGHQFTDDNGMYRLETIVPARYETRPPHIHVKVKSPNGLVLTSQMYFPNDPKNQTDSIFNQELIMSVRDGGSGKIAEFNFVLNE